MDTTISAEKSKSKRVFDTGGANASISFQGKRQRVWGLVPLRLARGVVRC